MKIRVAFGYLLSLTVLSPLLMMYLSVNHILYDWIDYSVTGLAAIGYIIVPIYFMRMGVTARRHRGRAAAAPFIYLSLLYLGTWVLAQAIYMPEQIVRPYIFCFAYILVFVIFLLVVNRTDFMDGGEKFKELNGRIETEPLQFREGFTAAKARKINRKPT